MVCPSISKVRWKKIPSDPSWYDYVDIAISQVKVKYFFSLFIKFIIFSVHRSLHLQVFFHLLRVWLCAWICVLFCHTNSSKKNTCSAINLITFLLWMATIVFHRFGACSLLLLYIYDYGAICRAVVLACSSPFSSIIQSCTTLCGGLLLAWSKPYPIW